MNDIDNKIQNQFDASEAQYREQQKLHRDVDDCKNSGSLRIGCGCSTCERIRVKELTKENAALKGQIAESCKMLSNIVCTQGEDSGVVLLSNDAVIHRNAGVGVYEHAYFSPLGDALMALHRMLSADQWCEPCGTERGGKCWGHCVGPDAEPTDLQIALCSADAGEDGDAGHWPTVAAVLAHEYRKAHTAVDECRETLCEVIKYQQASGPFPRGGEIMQRVKTTLCRIAIAGKSDGESHWKFCPECGSMKHHHLYGYAESHRYCLDCNQEWHTDIDYTQNAVRTNLARGFVALKYINELRERFAEVDAIKSLSAQREAAWEALQNFEDHFRVSMATDSESQREAAGTADEKPGGQAENSVLSPPDL